VARTLGSAMTHDVPVTRMGQRPAVRPSPRPAVWRWVMVLAVLAGFVAMHGMSADHGVHVFSSHAGDHHAAAVLADATGATVAAAWVASGGAGAGHAEDGCLLMVAASVLALVLAAIALRGAGLRLPAPPPRAGPLDARRAPPRRTAPRLFALGVLRT